MMKFIKTRDVQSPQRANATDSGLDFFVPKDLIEVQLTGYDTWKMHSVGEDTPIILLPWEWALIPSGIKAIIEPWYDLVFDNKSWVATKKHLIIGAKVVDSSYRWEVHLHVINAGKVSRVINLWDKLAQGIIRKVELITPEEITVEEFEENSNTSRGEGWFWSTGV